MTVTVVFKDAKKVEHVVQLADDFDAESAEQAAREHLAAWEDHGTTSYTLPLTLVRINGAAENEA